MTEVESHCFALIDEYARRRHDCFLAEFFRNQQGTNYRLCFRPAGISLKSQKRYQCKYMQFGIDDVVSTGASNELPLIIAKKLDDELPELGQSLTAEC